MSEEIKPQDGESETDEEMNSRRAFLRRLGRWSAIIIGGAALGGFMAPPDAQGWVNGRGGAAWVNGRGGGGGAGWVNRAGGGGSWINGAGGGGGWVNRAGGGGGSWVNRRG
jgi:hypothetical protein